jgi:hypothetical protein
MENLSKRLERIEDEGLKGFAVHETWLAIMSGERSMENLTPAQVNALHMSKAELESMITEPTYEQA